jgi:hypothetical protein
VLTVPGLFAALSFGGDGAVAFDGAAVRVLDIAGAAAGTIVGGLPGTVTLDLAAALFPGGPTGAHNFDRVAFAECTPSTCGIGPVLAAWDSGVEVASARPARAAFTLFKVAPLSAALPEKGDGPARYAALCEAYGMVPVGAGFGGGDSFNHCEAIAPLGGMCMPVAWGADIGGALRERTGWGRVAYSGFGDEVYGLDAGGDQTSAATGFCPICAIGH